MVSPASSASTCSSLSCLTIAHVDALAGDVESFRDLVNDVQLELHDNAASGVTVETQLRSELEKISRQTRQEQKDSAAHLSTALKLLVMDVEEAKTAVVALGQNMDTDISSLETKLEEMEEIKGSISELATDLSVLELTGLM
jgi:hypothetical protein